VAGPAGVGRVEVDRGQQARPGLGAVAWPDQTVWSGYGAGYGFAPLVLPVVALVVLRRQAARRIPSARWRPEAAVGDQETEA
jgi:hypothetical protein